jgi:hypothetical protein
VQVRNLFRSRQTIEFLIDSLLAYDGGAATNLVREGFTMKLKKLKKRKDKAILASVTKEMAQPRFAESCRKEEEEANHHIAARPKEHLKV